MQRAFQDNIRGAFGEVGERWLRELPALVEEAAREFGLTLEPPFQNLSYNYVAPGLREDGVPVVLKLGCVEGEVAQEREALRVFGPQRCVRVLASRGAAMVLERFWGEDASEEETFEAALGLAAEIHAPAPQGSSFPSVERWCLGLRGYLDRWAGEGPLEEALVSRAWGLSQELLRDREPQVLLHGDLHHGNVLKDGERGWCVIDPKGVVGERCFEVCALLRNPPGFAGRAGAREKLGDRVEMASQRTGWDRERITAWGEVESVLSAVWSVGEEGERRDVPMARWYRELSL